MAQLIDWTPTPFPLYGQHSWDLGPQQAGWTQFYSGNRVQEAGRQEDRNRLFAAISRENEERARLAEDRANQFSYEADLARQNRDLGLLKYGQDLRTSTFEKAEERARQRRAELETAYQFDQRQKVEREKIAALEKRYEPELTGIEQLDSQLNELDAETARVQVNKALNAERAWYDNPATKGKPFTIEMQKSASRIDPYEAENIFRRALPTIGKPDPRVRFDETAGRWTIRPRGPIATKPVTPKQPVTTTSEIDIDQRRFTKPPMPPTPPPQLTPYDEAQLRGRDERQDEDIRRMAGGFDESDLIPRPDLIPDADLIPRPDLR